MTCNEESFDAIPCNIVRREVSMGTAATSITNYKIISSMGSGGKTYHGNKLSGLY
jgi:hypothetical protein